MPKKGQREIDLHPSPFMVLSCAPHHICTHPQPPGWRGMVKVVNSIAQFNAMLMSRDDERRRAAETEVGRERERVKG